MIHTTIHSHVRAKERMNSKNLRKTQRQIGMALERGKRAEDFPASWEQNYLKQLGQEGYYAVAFNQYCYIFSNTHSCVTVYRLPKWFGKKIKATNHKRIHDHSYSSYVKEKSASTFTDELYACGYDA